MSSIGGTYHSCYLRGGFFLSSVLKTERVNADQQPGDCEQDIEKLNIRHTHHLRFCILLRRLHPVDLLAYEMIIACT